MDDIDTQLVAKAEAVALRPGDTLVLRFSEPVSAAQSAELAQRFHEVMGGKNDLLLVEQVSSVGTQSAQERPEHRACRRQS
jgi:hypothetical protein